LTCFSDMDSCRSYSSTSMACTYSVPSPNQGNPRLLLKIQALSSPVYLLLKFPSSGASSGVD
jgi:hypothetical protein